MEQKDNGCSGCGGAQVTVNAVNNNLVQKAPCRGCGSRNISGKLGTCKECMMLSAIGSVFCWIIFIIVFFFYPVRNAIFTALLFASLFTALLTAHGIAYVIKKNRKNKPSK